MDGMEGAGDTSDASGRGWRRGAGSQAGLAGRSPSSLETVAAPSPGGTRAAAGGDGRSRAAGARYHPAVSPQARAAEGHGGPGKALAFFQHPVRLLWPKSKAFDHLYSVGEKLLENFPVQATLCFYEDSGSEEEEEDDEEEEEEEEKDDEEEEATGDVTAGHPRNAGSPDPSRPA
ncbi:protein ripply1 [Melospiza melodia melodia]|uniref:protein ripply1 n=1 Tax=Melospiza melodia melodia TaxID=1914991 RepID=UPI002FD382AC